MTRAQPIFPPATTHSRRGPPGCPTGFPCRTFQIRKPRCSVVCPAEEMGFVKAIPGYAAGEGAEVGVLAPCVQKRRRLGRVTGRCGLSRRERRAPRAVGAGKNRFCPAFLCSGPESSRRGGLTRLYTVGHTGDLSSCHQADVRLNELLQVTVGQALLDGGTGALIKQRPTPSRSEITKRDTSTRVSTSGHLNNRAPLGKNVVGVLPRREFFKYSLASSTIPNPRNPAAESSP